MTLYLIGLGLGNEKDITVKGLEIIKSCDLIYLESYTSLLCCTKEELEQFYGKKIILANRDMAEQGEDHILEQAKTKNVAFLIIGDPFSATTHIEFIKTAFYHGVKVEVIHNASILTAIGETGLQLYKFGPTTSIPFLEDVPHLEAPYNIIRQNYLLGQHTLILLDLKPDQHKFMTINQAIDILEHIENNKKEKLIKPSLLIIVCARLGQKDALIKAGPLDHLKKIDFGQPPYCLIIPGKLHFMEQEMLELWK